MNLIKRLVRGLIYLLMGIVALFFLPLIIIVLVTLRIYIRSRYRRMERMLRKSWIARKKYILLAYEAGSEWKEYIEAHILPAYGTYVVAREFTAGRLVKKPEQPERHFIHQFMIRECNCDAADGENHNSLGIAVVTPKGFRIAQQVGDFDAALATPYSKEQLQTLIQDVITDWSPKK